jgi:thiol-disulfide isomerase/thioredoxin
VTGPPSEGGFLPDIVLSVPQNSDQKKYLGLSGEATFTIPQINASVVIVEIFSMYCPYCQAEAPSLNKLYYRIQNDRRLVGRFKLIGIGAGNTAFEVEYFRNTYKIPLSFPMMTFPFIKKSERSGHLILSPLGLIKTEHTGSCIPTRVVLEIMIDS